MNLMVMDFFANYIKETLGIVYEKGTYYQLESRLQELAKTEGCATIEDLHVKATKGIYGEFKTKLMDIATNNETSFFRDPRIFSQIESHIFPHFVEKGIKEIRMWSVACSFGQEIYSILMTHAEMPDAKKPRIKEFLASDISEKALKKASSGVYSHLETGRGLTPMMQKKYFDAATEPQHWQVKAELKNKVKFSSQNLLAPFHQLGKFDIILCRNVLIYQTVEAKKNIIDRLYDQLSENGILIMGVGESMIGLTDKFESFTADTVSIYKKRNTQQIKKAA